MPEANRPFPGFHPKRNRTALLPGFGPAICFYYLIHTLMFFRLVRMCFNISSLISNVLQPLLISSRFVEGFKFGWLLHWQYGDANGRKGQESVRAVGITLP